MMAGLYDIARREFAKDGGFLRSRTSFRIDGDLVNVYSEDELVFWIDRELFESVRDGRCRGFIGGMDVTEAIRLLPEQAQAL